MWPRVVRSPIKRWIATGSAALHSDANFPSVKLQYLKIDAKLERGDRSYPPVIVLHGLMASSAPKRDIYAVDLRNHGSSPHHGNTNYESMVADVRRFMDEMDFKQACLVGHSLGGKVGMILALESGERVSELIAIDIAPQQYLAPPEEDRPTIVALRAMVKTDPSRFKTREFNGQTLPAWVFFSLQMAAPNRRRGRQYQREVGEALRMHGVSSEKLRHFLLTNLVLDSKNKGHFVWRVNLRAIAEGLGDLLSFPEYDQHQKFTGKTLFVKGGLSHVILPSHRQEIMRLFPNARITAIDDAGHWVQADAPDAFAGVVNDFLGDSA